jgi:hypothetical protein
MAAVKKSTVMHPPFTRMVCDSMHALDPPGKDAHQHGHSLASLKKYMGEHYKVQLTVLCLEL